MAQAYPEQEDTPEAREGEAAHYYLTEAAQGRPPAVGSLAPNGHPITDEMVEGAAAMLADMRALIAQPGVRWAVEQRVVMPEVHPDNWGRADFIAVDETRQTLHVWDYKYGHGYVDAFENWQLLDYAIGAARHFDVTVRAQWDLDFRIYQPRSFHADGPVKSWRPSHTRYSQMFYDLQNAAHLAGHPGAPLSTGAHCSYCPARHACPALRKVGGLAVDMSMQGVPHDMDPADAGRALRTIRTARERLEDLETGLEAQILAAIRAGNTSTGWEAYQGYGRERWTVSAAEVVALGQLFGKDVAEPLDVITPAQARKLGIDEAVISLYTEKPKGEIKLRPLDSKNIRKAFQ
jgi:transposase